jgi:ribonuclease HII
MTGEQLLQEWRAQAIFKCRTISLSPFLGINEEKVRTWDKGVNFIIGADEVGRGSLAGPITVCAFLAPADWKMDRLRDSKKCTQKKRDMLFPYLLHEGLGHHVSGLPNTAIDNWGMDRCLQLLFEECVEQLRARFPAECEEALIVFDGDEKVRYIQHASLPKGDDIVQHVSAASVIAKVTRDRWMMEEAARLYPEYGFEEHMGYGTDSHRAALVELGPTPIHRMRFLKNLEKWRTE